MPKFARGKPPCLYRLAPRSLSLHRMNLIPRRSHLHRTNPNPRRRSRSRSRHRPRPHEVRGDARGRTAARWSHEHRPREIARSLESRTSQGRGARRPEIVGKSFPSSPTSLLPASSSPPL
jgi:hypothetical protein